MAPVPGRQAELRKNLLEAAAARWAERTARRDAGLTRIANQGPGAADSAKRQAEYGSREAAKANRAMINFPERMIGATLDLVQFAPSVQASRVAEPVARIVTLQEGRERQGVATGYLISPGMLLTNFHVFQVRSDARGYGANFHYVRDELGVRPGKYYELDPDRFFLSNEALDFAVVAVKDRSVEGDKLSEIGCLRLIEATGKVLTGLPVNIIQHPAGGPRQFAISQNKLVDILEAGFLHYESDTDRGSSGSPLFNTDWEIIGLHHSGVPATRDGRVLTKSNGFWDADRDPEDQIRWIANEGIRASFIVEALRRTQVTPAEQPLLAELLATTRDPVKAAAPETSAAIVVNPGPTGMASNVFHVNGPLTLHQYAAGTPLPQADVAVHAAAAAVLPDLFVEKSLVFDTDYGQREGYDPDFLGVPIPLPAVAPGRVEEIYTVGDYQAFYEEYRDVPEVDVAGGRPGDPMVLKYHHYSLVVNKDFRMCHWTASNYDYTQLQRQDTRSRAAFGGENWRPDPRVPPWHQLFDKDIYGPARRIDRGHIVRRDDNCWGDAGVDTEFANSDTYHWTNCTPQHEAFNQENPSDRSGQHVYAGGLRGLWGRFESQLAAQIEAGGGQAVLFAGPVLADFISSGELGYEGKVPRKFWKVVAFRESLKKNAPLLAYGYVFDQTTVVKKFGLTYEGLELPEFDRKRQSLAEIEILAGIVFPDVVKLADQPIP